MSNSKIILLLTFLFFRGIVSNAQTNLVPNGSFENHTQCSGSITYAEPWFSATQYGSPDYYNKCAGAIKVPGTSVGFQYPRTGNAHAGLFSTNYVAKNTREYIRTQLTTMLQPNVCYYVEFFANRINYCGYGNNNMAANFSNSGGISNDTLLTLTPHIVNYGNQVITDTLGWVRVSGIYTAIGGESYITIGNFKDDAHTDSVYLGGIYHESYYYIDDVSVTEIDSSYSPSIEYKDTAITKGQSVFIGSRTSGVNCKWFTNGTQIADSVPGITISPSITTTYTLEEHIPCSSTVRLDTIVVTVSAAVGISQLGIKNVELRIYPNPVINGELRIENAEWADRIEFYNLLGEKVLQTKATESIDVSGFSEGIYFVYFTNKTTNERMVKKLVITQ